MRAVFSIFSLIMFLSSSGLAHACLGDCSHFQKKEVSSASEHDCCEGLKTSKSDKKAHDCELGHCLKPSPFEPSTFTVESRLEKKEFSSQIAMTNQSSLVASLANVLGIDYRDTWQRHPNKVPLYIAYKKLLLP